MEQWTRQFVVRKHSALIDLMRSVGTYNKSKLGTNRRGTVMLASCRGELDEAGRFLVECTFRRGGRKWRVIGHPPLTVFGCSDFKKWLRKLDRPPVSKKVSQN